MYQRALERVAHQLEGQLVLDPAAVPTLVMLPVVGFGGQSSATIEAALAAFGRQRVRAGTLAVVALVNHPSAQTPDTTAMLAERGAARSRGGGGVQVAVATIATESRPLLGELRQLLLDAVRPLCAGGAATIVVADDDLVSAPAGYVERIRARLEKGARLAVGPVLFDDPLYPSALLPDFYFGDRLRALVAARWTERVGRLDLARRHDRDEAARLARDWFETIVLSTNLGVRAETLDRCGGFCDLDEITNLARSVQTLALAEAEPACPPHPNALVGLWDVSDGSGGMARLDAAAVRLSSRRALHAYARGRRASVEQWRSCRFRASRVDPVRLLPPPIPVPPRIARLGRTGRIELVERLEQVVATTLGYFPDDATIAAVSLRDLGVEIGPRFRTCTRVRGWERALELLEAKQEEALEHIAEPEQRIAADAGL